MGCIASKYFSKRILAKRRCGKSCDIPGDRPLDSSNHSSSSPSSASPKRSTGEVASSVPFPDMAVAEALILSAKCKEVDLPYCFRGLCDGWGSERSVTVPAGTEAV